MGRCTPNGRYRLNGREGCRDGMMMILPNSVGTPDTLVSPYLSHPAQRESSPNPPLLPLSSDIRFPLLCTHSPAVPTSNTKHKQHPHANAPLKIASQETCGHGLAAANMQQFCFVRREGSDRGKAVKWCDVRDAVGCTACVVMCVHPPPSRACCALFRGRADGGMSCSVLLG